jgi:hypothetical protein
MRNIRRHCLAVRFKLGGQPMSTELRSHADRVSLTRFWGGTDRGVCVQVTEEVTHSHVQLTRAQAAALAADLLDFAQGREQETFD